MKAISEAELTTAFRLLRENTSLQVVSNFLRNRDLPSSATSWDALVESRLKPALAAGSLERSDVIKLLRSVEEHGDQHILLFTVPKHISQPLMNEGIVRKALNKFDLESLLDNPRIVDLPTGLLLVDVRVSQGKLQRELVVKAIEGRSYRRVVSRKSDGDFETVVYENYRQRAVNVFRVQEDGSIDVRIQRHQRVMDYGSKAEELLALCLPLIERERVISVPVSIAKMYIASRPAELKGKVRWGNGVFKNKKGGGMIIHTGVEQQDLYDDEGAVDGSAAYLKKNDGYCEEANVYWVKSTLTKEPSDDVHTYIAGAANEFAVFGQCSPNDYEHVLAQIKRANRKH